ncbi:branched-chain amino acid ABC transporter permease [Paraburkholderia xenovorans]|uniref:branched-chain amino acid ABC transporter permease n=1 Tax=Paraburkholderia xenovorans TaxID=36873 RepID=UPI001F40C1F0|nr:branched-chain amino acid ABC transporter permease [Paraburkholderia xenovorans]
MVYALVALAMILIFSVTRVLFIAQGEFVAFGALTMASLEQRQIPGTVYILLIFGACCAASDCWAILRPGARIAAQPASCTRHLARIAFRDLVIPGMIAALVVLLAPLHLGQLVNAVLAVALVTPLGAMTYRLAFLKIADAGPLALLFVSVAVHFVLLGIGLSVFGAEGWRTQPFLRSGITLGNFSIQGQVIVVWCASGLMLLSLWLFFSKAYLGRVLIATARNRRAAKLMGVRPELAGKAAFGVAAAISALSGILIAPSITVYYDSGFLIVLKGLVAAVIGAMSSYPLAALGALIVGVTDSSAAFFASTFKDTIVFLLLIPFLLWMSVRVGRVAEVDEE